MNAVDIDQLSHSFASRTVLNNLSLSVHPGEIFGLLGPNGGGKTTLFRILSTSITPSMGAARIFGSDVVKESSDVRKKIGVVFQNPSLDRQLTLLENLIHQGNLYGLSGTDLQGRAEDALNRLSVRDRAHDIVAKLSGGLQRRGEIAKGLLHKPALLLMDEPSTGLDVSARRDMWNILLELKKEGVTIMLTTHLMEEGEHCDRLAIIHRGTCVALGTPAELKKKIGGDVISIQTGEAAVLAGRIKQKFSVPSMAVDGAVRIEIQDGHKFIPQLVEAFPGSIEAVTVGKPTLEDVFVHETGQRF